VTVPAPEPRWHSLALGVVIGLALVVLVISGILGFALFGRDGSLPPASPPSTGAAVASATVPPRTSSAPAATQPPSGRPSASPAAGLSGQPTAALALSASPSSAPKAVVDATLLQVLPVSVAGLPVREFPEAENQAVTDPDLGRNVSRVATAFVGDAGGSNWAYTSVVDVRPESRSDAFYRDWQESFDRSACERAGGVTGHTSVVIAGRDVERTACGSGVRVYHVRIKGTGLLISISDLGAAGYGEQEIAALRP
jgi:hypothetical protein